MMGMPTCREVTRAIASGSLAEASALRRFGARMHVLLCRHCRRYERQIRAIGKAARALLTWSGGEEEERVERLRQAILGRIGPPRAD